RRFAELVAELRPRRVLEIGTCKGGTLCVLCRLAAPDATIVSLDLPGGAYGGGYDAKRALVFRAFPRRGQRLHLVRGDSHLPQIRERVARALGGEPLDLVFIDGDHSYAGVKADYEMYSPMVRAGGVVAFHDIVEHPPEYGVGVGRFWREIRGPGAVEIIADPGQGWAGIGVLRR
ncbi:MAG: class I SAM-dependent methyltransferase, partial [Terriglobales bacterium]